MWATTQVDIPDVGGTTSEGTTGMMLNAQSQGRCRGVEKVCTTCDWQYLVRQIFASVSHHGNPDPAFDNYIRGSIARSGNNERARWVTSG
jgi:hypothetical protein